MYELVAEPERCPTSLGGILRHGSRFGGPAKGRLLRTPIFLTAFLIAGLLVQGPGVGSAVVPVQGVQILTTIDYVNVSATEQTLFTPSQVAVTPGDLVRLTITQLADFNHTFTLSPLANFTFTSSNTSADLSAFFHAHPPLVNLSLGSVPGKKSYANFTAPPKGSYEFVCLENGHFRQGMHGELLSGVAAPANVVTPITTLDVTIAGAIALGLAVGILAVVKMRRRVPPAPPTQPPT
ncbi:MAG: hypothetical protein L3J93_01240 [Thermoplasmata archaeon]|nr:hypothetical protein [Thermoplasmata archaeon]